MKIEQRPYSQQAFDALAPLPDVLRRIYAARGINTTVALEKSLQHLLNYKDLTDIDTATARLKSAIEKQERILIVGDFDADGATSSALGVSALRALGANHVEYLVPNRFTYGYGLTPEIVDVAKKWQPDLIITVDNGIASIEGVVHANALGIDVIITDHHLPGHALPNAVAIVNPNCDGCRFNSKNLAGVGVIFYVMSALRRTLFPDGGGPNMAQFLDLVALGTVADVVSLDKNNRILVEQGLKRIQAGKSRPGIEALLQIAKKNAKTLTSSDLGFTIAPRLNAAGRLDDMSLGIECLLSETLAAGLEKAQALDALNQERKAIEAEMKQQALLTLAQIHIDQETLPHGLCLYDPQWHQGVIGILAGRLKDKLNRPVVIFAKASDDTLKGSCRSINGIHIRDVLDAIATKNPGLISKFGGHAMAAGLSLPTANFVAFEKAFSQTCESLLDPSMLEATLYTDGSLGTDNLHLDMAESLAKAGPWGQSFPAPVFDDCFKLVDQRIVGANHLKLTLSTDDGLTTIGAIKFNIDESVWPNYRVKRVRVVYRLEINEYQGFRNPQLLVEHITPV